MRLRPVRTVAVLLAAAAELAALYYSETSYSRRELEKIKSKPLLKRPNRPGHLVGNFLRLVHRLVK